MKYIYTWELHIDSVLEKRPLVHSRCTAAAVAEGERAKPSAAVDGISQAGAHRVSRTNHMM